MKQWRSAATATLGVILAILATSSLRGQGKPGGRENPNTRLPRATGYADIQARYGAVGDGKADDTTAFQKAFAELADAPAATGRQTLYLPNGVYLVSDTLRWHRFLTLIGESREKTIIRLRDGCSGFGSKNAPKALVSSASVEYNAAIKAGKGSPENAGNYLFDLTIDTGSSNPGAIALDYESHHSGMVANVTLRAGEGSGYSGLDLQRPQPGPCLIRNLRVEGFDVGIAVRSPEYGVTLFGITLLGQRTAGIRNDSNAVSIEHLASRNRVPALVNRGGGQVVVIGGKLEGGAGDAFAIENFGAVYLRGVETSGYRGFLRDGGKEYREKKATEWVTAGGANSSLILPLADAPDIPWGTPKEWANVRDFIARRGPDGDWGPAIGAAIDSGAKTVYFPAGEDYAVQSDVPIRGKVVRLYGMNTIIAGNGAFVFDGPQKAVAVERLTLASARHESATDLMVRAGGIQKLDAGPNCGRLFLEDYHNPLRLNRYQRVWVRQLSSQSESEPAIVNDGGRLWVLGFTAESSRTNIISRNGASTEILGGLINVTRKPAPDVPMFVNENADLSLIHLISAYAGTPAVYLRETKGNQATEIRTETAQRWVAGRPLIPLFTSRLTAR